jgi:hypothetical protein
MTQPTFLAVEPAPFSKPINFSISFPFPHLLVSLHWPDHRPCRALWASLNMPAQSEQELLCVNLEHGSPHRVWLPPAVPLCPVLECLLTLFTAKKKLPEQDVFASGESY